MRPLHPCRRCPSPCEPLGASFGAPDCTAYRSGPAPSNEAKFRPRWICHATQSGAPKATQFAQPEPKNSRGRGSYRPCSARKSLPFGTDRIRLVHRFGDATHSARCLASSPGVGWSEWHLQTGGLDGSDLSQTRPCPHRRRSCLWDCWEPTWAEHWTRPAKLRLTARTRTESNSEAQ